jgi:uncharacterized protein involved in outer membrane biogenesis
LKLALKVGLIGVVVLTLLIAIAGFWIDSMIKAGLETVGPRITRTAVTLERVRVSLLSGQGRIQGMVIGNPEGFQTENAFRLGDTRIRLNIGSVFSDRVVIDELVVDGPEVTYERGRSGSNIDQIQKNVEAFGSAASPTPPSSKTAKEDESARRKFQINRLIVKNGRVRLSAAFMEGKAIDVSLPDIELKDIGSGSNGATLKEVVSRVFEVMQNDIGKAVASGGTTFKPEFGTAQEKAKEIGGQAEKATSGAIKNLKGLFGK